jgi:hypothetical protein
VIKGESVNELPKGAVLQVKRLASDRGILGMSVSKVCVPPTRFQSRVDVAACTFGDKHSNRTIVLVGDDKAEMWVDVFIQIATASHVKLIVLVKSACPAALGTFRLVNAQGTPGNSPWPACTAWHNFVLSTIKKLAPEVVVNSSLDTLYLTSAARFASPSQVERAFTAFLRGLPAGAKRVLIGGFPSPGDSISPGLCLSRFPSAVKKCDFRPTTYRLADNAALQQAAERNRAGFINQSTWLCAAECPPVIAGVIPYTFDGFHVQAGYATYLTGVMWAALKPYLGD